jgi:hypothetical protein
MALPTSCHYQHYQRGRFKFRQFEEGKKLLAVHAKNPYTGVEVYFHLFLTSALYALVANSNGIVFKQATTQLSFLTRL